MKNKKAGFTIIIWIYVAIFLFLVVIALIEPLKGPLNDSMGELSCSTTTDNFIKPVCFLLKGTIVLFVGGYIFALFKWVNRKGQER